MTIISDGAIVDEISKTALLLIDVQNYCRPEFKGSLFEDSSKNPYFAKEMEQLRAFRRSGLTYDDIRVKAELTETYRTLAALLKNAKEVAEARLMSESPQLNQSAINQQVVDSLVKQNRIPEAGEFLNFHRK